jgi:hypothetical protein
VIQAALPEPHRGADICSAAELLALAVSYRHATARHVGDGPLPAGMHRELDFLADALILGAGAPGGPDRQPHW